MTIKKQKNQLAKKLRKEFKMPFVLSFQLAKAKLWMGEKTLYDFREILKDLGYNVILDVWYSHSDEEWVYDQYIQSSSGYKFYL